MSITEGLPKFLFCPFICAMLPAAERKFPLHLLFPVAIFIIAALRCFFAEGLPVNQGLGWDGTRYYWVTLYGLASPDLDSYLALRVFPSLLVRTVLRLLDISLSPTHVLWSFKIMHLICVGFCALMAHRIFNRFALHTGARVLGFTLLLFNCAVLNFTFYYPVMTDMPAFTISLALLYFFFEGHMLNVLLLGIMGAFTWPVLLLQAILLLVFPKTLAQYEPLPRTARIVLQVALGAMAFFIALLLLFYKHNRPDFLFALPLSEAMLPYSIALVVLVVSAFAWLAANKSWWQWRTLSAQFSVPGITSVVLLLVAFLALRFSMGEVKQSEYIAPLFLLNGHWLYAFVRPLITLCAHLNFFGVAMVLLVLFWKNFAEYVSALNIGIALMLLVNLLLFSVKPESRASMNIFPWFAVLLALCLGQFRFSTLFYVVAVVAAFLLSKIWWPTNYTNNVVVNPDGTVPFPTQQFYMHLGIWMTQDVWLVLFVLFAVLLLIFALISYRIEISNAIYFYRKFANAHEPIESTEDSGT